MAGQGKWDQRPREGAATLGEAAAGVAFRTDARVIASGLLALFRPGPGASLDPIAAGPRARVPVSATASHRMRDGSRQALQRAVLAGGTPGPVPTTTRMIDGQLATRASTAHHGPPLSYTYRYVGPTGLAPDPEGADPTPDRKPLPDGCVDCG